MLFKFPEKIEIIIKLTLCFPQSPYYYDASCSNQMYGTGIFPHYSR